MRFLGSLIACGLAGALALLGCQISPTVAPDRRGSLGIEVRDQQIAQGRDGLQAVAFGVRWPESKTPTTQAIPDGARLIRFTVSAGTEQVAEVDVIRDPSAATASKTVMLFPGEYGVIARAYPDLQVTGASPILADGGASFIVTEGRDAAVSITLTPRPSPSPTSAPSSSPSPMTTSAPTPSPSASSAQPSPSPQATPTPSPFPTATAPVRTVNIKAETLLGFEPVAGVRIAFQDVSGVTVGSVTTGADGRAAIALPATKSNGYWGAYYKLFVTVSPGVHFSVATSPDTGGTNDLMVPPYGGVGDGSQPSSFACTVIVSTW